MMSKPIEDYDVIVYHITKEGEGRIYEVARINWKDFDSIDLPPLPQGSIYQICFEKVYTESE